MLVLRTYLALRRDAGGNEPTGTSEGVSPRPTGHAPPPAVRLDRARDLRPDGYRALYSAVGREFNWRDRLAWDDARLAAYLDDPTVAVWLLTVDGSAAGYFELRRHGVELPSAARALTDDGTSGGTDDAPAIAPASERPCELVYFGLARGARGRGLGRWLLERAIAEVWAGGADLLWLHTCSLDHPAALPNYRARGFHPFATLLYEEDVPDPPLPTTTG